MTAYYDRHPHDSVRRAALEGRIADLGGYYAATQEDRDTLNNGEGCVILLKDDTEIICTDGALQTLPVYVRTAYNASDMNRVETAVAELSKRLYALGYNVKVISARVWVMKDIPKPDDTAVYLQKIKSLSVLPLTAPTLPNSLENMTMAAANSIEEFLDITKKCLDGIETARHYMGDVFAGEV